MKYQINIKQSDNEIQIDIKSKHSHDRKFNILVDENGLHIGGNDNLSMTWNNANKLTIDTVT